MARKSRRRDGGSDRAASGSVRRLRLWLLGMVVVSVALAVAPIVHAADGPPTSGADVAQTQAVTGQATPPEQVTQPATQQAAAAPGRADGGAVSETVGSGEASGSGGPASAGGDHPAADTNQGAAEKANGDGNKSASAPDTAGAQGSEPESECRSRRAPSRRRRSRRRPPQQPRRRRRRRQHRVHRPARPARGRSAADTGEPGAGQRTGRRGRRELDAGDDRPGGERRCHRDAVRRAEHGRDSPRRKPRRNGAVQQANTAGAHAATSVTPPAKGHATNAESAIAAAAQDGASNTNVSIRVFSPGSDGTVGQSNHAAAAAETSGPDGANATATQAGARNTNVSIRVESDGTTGAVTQMSGSTATASGDGDATATTQGGLDTDLSVVVDGNDLVKPGDGGLQIWEWTWTLGSRREPRRPSRHPALLVELGLGQRRRTRRRAGDAAHTGARLGHVHGWFLDLELGLGPKRQRPTGCGTGTSRASSHADPACGSGTGRGTGRANRFKPVRRPPTGKVPTLLRHRRIRRIWRSRARRRP